MIGLSQEENMRRRGAFMHERRFNPEHMAKLESPERRALLPPEPLLIQLDVSGSVSVLDIGAGTGYFAIPAAERTKGVVYALDVEPKMLETIKGRAEERNLMNIRTTEGALEQIPLEDGTVDRIIASLVLHEAETLKQAIGEIVRVLRRGGRCLCLEWEKKTSEQGPPLHHRIHSDEMKQAMEQNGLQILFFEHPTESHYVLIAQK
jgi:ubiquinone/menaquinone biosynthesis C-methylase UbiE